MRAWILYTFFMGGLSSLSASEHFYYSRGQEIPIIQELGKVALVTPLCEAPIPPQNFGLRQLSASVDTLRHLQICEIFDFNKYVRSENLDFQLSSSSVYPCFVNQEGLELIPTGYIDVKLNSIADLPLLREIAAQHSCSILEPNSFMPLWYKISLTGTGKQNPVAVANEIYQTGNFASVSPDFSFCPWSISYDPEVTLQWALYNSEYEGIDISASEAWSYATGRGIVVAIIDQGIELTHDDLAPNIYPLSYDAYTQSCPSGLYNDGVIGHGTHCAGIVAAVRNNGCKITGAAPDAQLMSISNNFTVGGLSQFANSINWAWQNGADVISCSWRSPTSDIIKDAIDMALTRGRAGRGSIVVAAAGNHQPQQSPQVTFPANYRDEVIAVGNLTRTGIISEDSNYGPQLMVCAPGAEILSTMVNDSLAVYWGTSMACPYVAAEAALILERNPNLTVQEVREIIARNVMKVGDEDYLMIKEFGTWNQQYGYGLIDALEALRNTPRRE